MCKFKFHILIAVLTFGIGILGVSFWLLKSTELQIVEEELPVLENNNFTGKTNYINPDKEFEFTKSSPKSTRWIAPSYLGLKLGKATEKDVEKLFGKPQWEGLYEGCGEEETADQSEDLKLLQYGYIEEAKGGIEVYIGVKTKVVKSIIIYSSEFQNKQSAVSQFGSDYFELSADKSLCIDANYKESENAKEDTAYPVNLVYPNKGMYISIQENNSINFISYSQKCTN